MSIKNINLNYNNFDANIWLKNTKKLRFAHGLICERKMYLGALNDGYKGVPTNRPVPDSRSPVSHLTPQQGMLEPVFGKDTTKTNSSKTAIP